MKQRVFVEKRQEYATEATQLLNDLVLGLQVKTLVGTRIINVYDICNVTEVQLRLLVNTVFSEPQVDEFYYEYPKFESSERIFVVEYLPGQYDQRADSANQCIQIRTMVGGANVKTYKLIALKGTVSDNEFSKIKDYCINKVEAREAKLDFNYDSSEESVFPQVVESINGFINMDVSSLNLLLDDYSLAMSTEDLLLCRNYFRDIESRDPTLTEIKVLDTYWSDHCRHTTFNTYLKSIQFEQNSDSYIREAFQDYMDSRQFINSGAAKEITLMDIATINAKEFRKKGLLNDLELSDEINAASIIKPIEIEGNSQDYLIMFKNETHNHPTEIEPFGGASTCLGGAIRDPLSGRAYVYQAMRVTGSGDPRKQVDKTLPGKLPQRKITTGAAAGFSSYGNQIGLATGQVVEIYDEGYVAKRMEIGAVIAAAPKSSVKRLKPLPGDVVILVGGKTGRDGCGGATGSSKVHSESSLSACAAEVQKGNPVEERKIQRLFRNPFVTSLIKKCNDFGAGGVSVAIGELADGLIIDLNSIPKKYEGLNGTEIAISESQERMAVIVSEVDAETFIKEASKENLEATVVATVTDNRRLVMLWNGKAIVDLSRDFLDTNGSSREASVKVVSPDLKNSPFQQNIPTTIYSEDCINRTWLENLSKLNVCSQLGLTEKFDSTIGAGTVLLPYGGLYQLTPQEGMVAKIPVLENETSACTIMTHGFNPEIAKWSPFHAGMFSIIEAVSKIIALGGDLSSIRLTMQEYFERLFDIPEKWGKVFAALLGAYHAQKKLALPAIGGKDSMSGTYKDLDVPPTIVAFAVGFSKSNLVVSSEFKKTGSQVILISAVLDEFSIPDFDLLVRNFKKIQNLIEEKKVLASATVKSGGISEAISKMCFGNKIGFEFSCDVKKINLFSPDYGSLILEIPESIDVKDILEGYDYEILGKTIAENKIKFFNNSIDLASASRAWCNPLEDVFPTKVNDSKKALTYTSEKFNNIKNSKLNIKPTVLIPVFPGTNCEYDTARAFTKAGAKIDTFVFRNKSIAELNESILTLEKRILNAQIICFPGGFSAGDEPDGSGKFIAAVFRNTLISDAISSFLNDRNGLVLGICNGFQALIKLGLLPFGKITEMHKDSPTLTHNKIGRHVSRMVRTRVSSVNSPWLNNLNIGDVHSIPVSHGEGRFVATENDLKSMEQAGQIVFQYVDENNLATYEYPFNPNGSINGIEGIVSPDGRILGKMGHSERIGDDIHKNFPGLKDQKLFEAGVSYFS